MNWLQLRLVIDRDAAAAVEAALEAGGALAVTLDDAGDAPLLEPEPQARPLWRQVRVTALYADDPDGQQRARLAAGLLAERGVEPVRIERLEDRAWERVWLAEAHPMRFGGRLWICPRGQRPPASGARSDRRQPVIVELDPGLAFGTGHHPTTALCLRWLDQSPLHGQTLVDFGCGSGILAIAAIALGAARAVAIDHDQQALEATLANAAVNGVSDRIEVAYPQAPSIQPADLVVANILAGPLQTLAPRLIELTRPGGRLALSGLLREQGEETAACYRGAFDLAPEWEQDGWLLLHGSRKG
jgi:ribosomal protein L11 methyltransferase